MITEGKTYYLTNPYKDEEGRTTKGLDKPKSGQEKRREKRAKARRNNIKTYISLESPYSKKMF